MKVLQCNSCGATLLPEGSFCRQCGARVPDEPPREQLNTTFSEPADNVVTQRLYPRETGGRGGMEFRPPLQPAPVESPAPPRAKTHPLVFGGVVLMVLLLAIVAVVAVMKTRTPTRIVKVVGVQAPAESDLVYPGASKMLDVSSPDGSRVLQLRTDDPLDSVQMWYDMNLRPTKTVRLSNLSVVLKNDKVTATILSENNKTNILIKQIP